MAFDVEQLFGSIDIILDKRLENLSFDKTIICTIVDDSDKHNGKYIVSDGTIKFEAYAEEGIYRKDDKVRVSILNGDFTQEKYIVGKHNDKESNLPISYKSPLSSVIPIGELLNTRDKAFGLVANGRQKTKLIANIDFSSFQELYQEGIANSLTLKADFKTLLKEYDLRKGNYGLRLEIYSKTDPDSNVRMRQWITLDNSDMFGNPYNFEIYTTQEKKIDLIVDGYISEIAVWLYQGLNENAEESFFMNISGEKCPVYENENDEPEADDILVKDIEIWFGSDIERVPNKTLKLFTLDGTLYRYKNPSPSTNSKKMQLLWYNKTEDNAYVGFDDGSFDEAYDEITYLTQQKEVLRIESQLGVENIPQDESGLRLSANIKDIEPLISQTNRYISEDLWNAVQELNDIIKGNYTQFAGFENLSEEVRIASEKIKPQYKQILKYAYERFEVGSFPAAEGDIWEEDYYSSYRQEIDSLFSKLNKYLSDLQKNLDDALLKSRYDVKINKIKKIENKISINLKSIDELVENDFYDLIDYSKDDYVYTKYISKNLAENVNNKYCFYWYHYDKNYEPDPDEMNFMGKNWQRIEDVDTITKFYTHYMNPKFREEKFVVVMFYNHIMYQSNILTFTNIDEIPLKYLIEYDKDALKIIHKEKSFDHYQSYNQFNVLRNEADRSIARKLQAVYNGEQVGNEIFAGAGITWCLPKSNTMLTYDPRHVSEYTFGEDDEYYYFFKQVSKDEYDEVYFSYKIKSFLDPAARNNTIKLRVQLEDVPDILETEVSFSFSTFGSNGTKFTLAITPEGNQVAVTDRHPLALKVSLRDYNNEPVEIEEDNFVVTWLNDTIKYDILDKTTEFLSISVDSNESAPFFGILNAKVKLVNVEENEEVDIGGEQLEEYQKKRVVDLNTLYSVPYSSYSGYYITGASLIVYNSQGTLSQTDESPYCLYDEDGIKVYPQHWELKYWDTEKNSFVDNSEEIKMLWNYMPVLNNKNSLTPAPFYISGLEGYIPVVICSDGNEVLWSQAIIITQNRYESSTLNDWNGSFQINEENGTVLGTMFGAGKKNRDNTFSGVLMGDVALGADYPDIDAGLPWDFRGEGIGLYGFQSGEQSFCFNSNGTAFIGKSGKGRIFFDGNKGIIASASRILNYDHLNPKLLKEGMLIDLDDGFLDILGGNTFDSHVRIDQASPHLIIETPTEEIEIIDPDNPGSSYQNKIKVPIRKRLLCVGKLYEKDENGRYVVNNSKTISNEYYRLGATAEEPYGYYLKSKDYLPTIKDPLDNKKIKSWGSGFLIDLENDLIDAFYLKVDTKNVLIDSSPNANPYFVVRADLDSEVNEVGPNLLYVDKNEYYLQSYEYAVQETYGVAVVLNVDLVGFTYTFSSPPSSGLPNFEDANGTIAADTKIKIYEKQIMGAASPWYRITPKGSEITQWVEGVCIQIISSEETGDSKKGMKIDLQTGKIEGGSVKPWSIDAEGFAKFQYIEANGGKFNGIEINGRIGGLIKGDLIISGNGAIKNQREDDEGNKVTDWSINLSAFKFGNELLIEMDEKKEWYFKFGDILITTDSIESKDNWSISPTKFSFGKDLEFKKYTNAGTGLDSWIFSFGDIEISNDSIRSTNDNWSIDEKKITVGNIEIASSGGAAGTNSYIGGSGSSSKIEFANNGEQINITGELYMNASSSIKLLGDFEYKNSIIRKLSRNSLQNLNEGYFYLLQGDAIRALMPQDLSNYATKEYVLDTLKNVPSTDSFMILENRVSAIEEQLGIKNDLNT